MIQTLRNESSYKAKNAELLILLMESTALAHSGSFFKKRFIFLKFMCMNVLLALMYTHHMQA